MKIDDIEKINAKIKEKFGIRVYTFKIDDDWVIVPEDENGNDIEMEKFVHIKKYFLESLKDIEEDIDDNNEIIGNIIYKNHKIDIHENSWKEYIKELSPLFEMVKYDMTDVLNIRVPNEKEFRTLITILKDKYGSRKIDFLMVEIGFDKFYNILRTSGLSNIVKIIDLTNERFDDENFGKYDIEILEPVTADIHDKGLFSLRITEDSLSSISRIAQDLRLTVSEVGFISCIFTFNIVREEFRDLISDKFKVYCKNNGYAQIIRDKIDRIVEDGIKWAVNILPMMIEDIERLNNMYMKQIDKDKDRIKEELLYKEQAVEEIANMILDNLVQKNIQICCREYLSVRLIVDEMNNTAIKDQDLSFSIILMDNLRDHTAKEKFEKLIGDGWLAIKEKSVEKGERGKRVESFDQDADRILFLPPILIKGKR